MIVRGAATPVTNKSAKHNANNNGFLSRDDDCEHSVTKSVTLPITPLNTTTPYKIIKTNSVIELMLPFPVSISSSESYDDEFVVTTVARIGDNRFFVVVFLIVANFISHCLLSILYFVFCKKIKREKIK